MIKCSECGKDEYRIVVFEIIKHDEKLDILLPICEKCAEELNQCFG